MNCTSFLAGLLAGDVGSNVLSSELTPSGHTFRPYRAVR
jgi:hypothetical protein